MSCEWRSFSLESFRKLLRHFSRNSYVSIWPIDRWTSLSTALNQIWNRIKNYRVRVSSTTLSGATFIRFFILFFFFFNWRKLRYTNWSDRSFSWFTWNLCCINFFLPQKKKTIKLKSLCSRSKFWICSMKIIMHSK